MWKNIAIYKEVVFMKVDAGSSGKPLNGNIGVTRKLADHPTINTLSQDDLKSMFNSTAIKSSNLDEPHTQLHQGEPQPHSARQEKEKIEKALKIINMAYKEVNVECRYSMDERTNTEVVKIINSETGEMIRQYPPEDILNMIHKMYDMYGILMDKKV
jgi:flagellar protein FlaG